MFLNHFLFFQIFIFSLFIISLIIKTFRVLFDMIIKHKKINFIF